MILLIIAIVLLYTLSPFLFIFEIVYLIVIGGSINQYLESIAYSIDQTGNVIGRAFLNTTMKTKEGYNFGNPDEPISSALGKNKVNKSLTLIGRILSYLLNYIDKNHVEKSIEKFN